VKSEPTKGQEGGTGGTVRSLKNRKTYNKVWRPTRSEKGGRVLKFSTVGESGGGQKKGGSIPGRK